MVAPGKLADNFLRAHDLRLGGNRRCLARRSESGQTQDFLVLHPAIRETPVSDRRLMLQAVYRRLSLPGIRLALLRRHGAHAPHRKRLALAFVGGTAEARRQHLPEQGLVAVQRHLAGAEALSLARMA